VKFVKIKKISKVFNKMPATTLVSSPESIRWSTCKKNGVKAPQKLNSGQSNSRNSVKVKCQKEH